jgi:hypothetical protein
LDLSLDVPLINITSIEFTARVPTATVPMHCKAHHMDAELKSALEKAYPGEEARYFLPMSIGSTPEHADEGARLG